MADVRRNCPDRYLPAELALRLRGTGKGRCGMAIGSVQQTQLTSADMSERR